jgi:hypothetical protein
MFKKIGLLLLGGAFFLGGFAAGGFAQEESDDFKVAFGTVAGITATEVVISEYNTENDTEENITYGIDSETHVEEVAGIEAIKAGDEIEIFYEEVDGKKAARYISPGTLLEDDATEEYDDSYGEDDEEEPEPIEEGTNATQE